MPTVTGAIWGTPGPASVPSRRNPEFYRDGTINWFKTGELKDRALYESEEKITPQALEESSAKIFPVHTVLIALYGDGDTITNLGFLRRRRRA